ncbi:hypothetical protein [Acidovorax delafieldii]|nr:hypothetical protein [Acidovorax delafieldii]
MTDRTQPEALQLAEILEGDLCEFPLQEAAAELRRQHARIAELEAQLEAIGAGGVNGPLMGQPQAMPDLSALTERGAKAWAGVDAQGLREVFTAANMATAAAQGFRDGVASVAASAESEPVGEVEYSLRFTGGFHVRLYRGATMPDPGTKLYTNPSSPEGMVMVPKDALSKCKVALERYSQVPPNYHNSVLRLRDSMRELLLAAWSDAPTTTSADSRKGE